MSLDMFSHRIEQFRQSHPNPTIEEMARLMSDIELEYVAVYRRRWSCLKKTTIGKKIDENVKLRKVCPADLPESCVICLTEYKGEEIIGGLDCGHEYHEGCIKRWLLMTDACPFCRQKILGAIW